MVMCVSSSNGVLLSLVTWLSLVLVAATRNDLSPPTFTTKLPREVAYKTGERQTLRCEARADPAPTYEWKKDGEPLDYEALDVRKWPGSGTITIEEPLSRHAGIYQCFASNSYGTAVSAKTMLQQAVLDSFPTKTDPTRHRTLVGDYLKLPCVPPESYPKGGVYWGMDTGGQNFTAIEETSRVALDYDGSLYFANVLTQDSLETDGRTGLYSCILVNKMYRGQVQGDEQKVEPREITGATPRYHAPQLQWSSPTYTVALNGTMQHRMKCIFSGLPTPEVTWTSKTHGWDSSRYELRSFGQEMIITRLQFSDRGTYTCAGSNKDGVSITREFRLIVESMPMWLEKPEHTTSAEEEDVEFHCRAGGVPRPTLTWTVNGVPIEDLPPDSRRHVTTNTIFYRNLTMADSQVLQCNASNKHGYKFENAFLNVRADQPSFIRTPQGVTKVAVDQEVTIHCQVYGAPKPRITWRYGNPPVEVQRNRRFHIMPNGDLVIKSVQLTDEGAYQCLAENKFGKEHASGELIVRQKTTITEFPRDQVVNASTDVVFHCNATTDGDEKERLVYEWRRNGEAIDYTRVRRTSKNMNDHSLRITKATVDDTGHYTCVASNGIDSDESTAQLTVRDRPSQPRDLELNSCTAQSAQVQWVPGSENHDIVREYIVFYNTSFDESGVFHVGNTVGRGISMTRVTLSPWANYTFHVKARNSLGLSDPSEFTRVCTTVQMIPYNHPKDPCTESERPDQLVITWQPMPKIEHNGDGFRYVVKYRRYDIPGAEDVVRELTDWEQSRLVVDNVPTYQPFVISIQANNDIGFAPSNKLKTLLGHSGDDTPLDSPQNFAVLNDTINATHAMFEWNAVPDDPDRIRGHFVGYRVLFWKADNKEDKRSVELIKNPVEHCPAYPGRPRRRGGDQSVKETVHTNELWPYSRLQAAVLVLNSVQTGPLSDVISFSTPEGDVCTRQFIRSVSRSAGESSSCPTLRVLTDVPLEQSMHVACNISSNVINVRDNEHVLKKCPTNDIQLTTENGGCDVYTAFVQTDPAFPLWAVVGTVVGVAVAVIAVVIVAVLIRRHSKTTENPVYGMPSAGGTAMTSDGGTARLPDGGTAMTPDRRTAMMPDGRTAMTPDRGTAMMPDGRTAMMPGGTAMTFTVRPDGGTTMTGE